MLNPSEMLSEVTANHLFFRPDNVNYPKNVNYVFAL